MIRFRIFSAFSSRLPRATAMACLTAALASGCASHDPSAPPIADPEEGARADQLAITAVRDAGVANAIVSQHTLYPYHFVANGKDLNELGERDLAVLADFYRANPGDLNVRHGDVPAEIYDARVRAVQDALARDGVDVARVAIADKLPLGSGLPSEDVIHILRMNFKDMGKGYLGGAGSESMSGGGDQSSAAGGAGAPATGGGSR